MSNLVHIPQAISALREHYSFGSDTALAKYLGVAISTLNSWKKRDGWNANNLSIISSKCVDVNLDALLRGEEYIGKDKKGDTKKHPTEDTLREMQGKIKAMEDEIELLRKEVNRLATEKMGFYYAAEDAKEGHYIKKMSPQKRHNKGEE